MIKIFLLLLFFFKQIFSNSNERTALLEIALTKVKFIKGQHSVKSINSGRVDGERNECDEMSSSFFYILCKGFENTETVCVE